MTPATLATIGRALYGDRWQSNLARDIGIRSRDVRYWAAGDRVIPEWFEPTLRVLCLARLAELERAIDTLSAHNSHNDEDRKKLSGACFGQC